VPLLVDGTVLGVLAIATSRARPFDARDLQLLELVADGVAFGLASREDMDGLFEEAAMGLHWIGPDGTILRANRAALDILGYARDEYVGRHMADFHADREVADDVLARLVRGETLHGHEARLRGKDGSIRHVLLDANVLWRDGRFVHGRCCTRDVTTERRAEDALRESEERYRRIVELANEGVWLIDGEGRTRFANGRMAEMLGCTVEELVGRRVHEFVFEDDLPQGGEWIGTQQVDFRFRRCDGSEILVLAATSPVTDGEGHTVGALGMFSDITLRKHAEAEREELLDAAERANAAKDDFLAMLSHELRSPLAAIRTWASLLRSGRLDAEKTGRAVEAIERNSITQARLIEDLLDVSRICSGKLALELATVELEAVVDAALDAVRAAADEKQVRLEKVVTGGRSELAGDAARLQQVVWNLVSNAVKFSRPAGVVTVHLTREEGHAIVSVADTGEGIPPELLPHVFERFRQGDSTSTRSHGGLGLGLAIVRHVVELHRGSVHAASAGPGRGATFTVRLPLGPDTPRTAPFLPKRALSGRPFAAGPILAGLRILLVEDDGEARASIAAVLEECHGSVTLAASVEQALEGLRRARFDVVVSDIAMPGEDGYGLVRRLRAGDVAGHRDVPAVALTAYAGAEDRQRALRAGFHAHLPKPIDPAELVDTLARLR
jgi:PAS domain S-box-containing protein